MKMLNKLTQTQKDKMLHAFSHMKILDLSLYSFIFNIYVYIVTFILSSKGREMEILIFFTPIYRCLLLLHIHNIISVCVCV